MSINQDNMEAKLSSLGIRGKQARFYIAALEVGDGTVHEIARKAGIGRTTAYALFEKLRDEGLVTQVQMAGRTHVVAENPDVLARNLDDKRRALAEMLPELRSLYDGGGGSPRFRLYDGVEGINTVLNSVLAADTDVIRGILSMRELLASPGRAALDRFITERVTSGKRLQVLRSQDEETDDIWQSSERELREVRYAPTGSFVMTMFLFDNKVGLISSRQENYGLIIESKEFANLQTSLFDVMWQASGTE